MENVTAIIDPEMSIVMVNYHERKGEFARQANDEVSQLFNAYMFKVYQLLSKSTDVIRTML